MKKFVLLAGFSLLPTTVAFAVNDVDSLFQTITGILDKIVPLLLTLAVLFFFFGLTKFILKADDPEEQKKAKSIMLWGVIAIFVMISIWGLVAILTGTFDLDSQLPIAPDVLPDFNN